MASDQSSSFGHFDLAGQYLKAAYIAEGWRALFCGEAPTAWTVVDRISRILDSHHVAPPLEDVVRACDAGYSAEWERAASIEICGRYGTTLEKLRSNGSDIGPQSRREMLRSLKKFSLGVNLIVCGVMQSGITHFIHVAAPGKANVYKERDVADGTGWDLAQRGLAMRGSDAGLFPTIFRVCAAKFDAESAKHVDKFTTLSWMSQLGNERPVSYQCIDRLREVWSSSPKDAMPSRALDILRQEFSDVTNVQGTQEN